AAVTSEGGAISYTAGTSISFTAKGSIDAQSGAPAVTLTAKNGAFTMGDGSYVDGAGGPVSVTATGNALLTLLKTTGDVMVSSGGSILDGDVAVDNNDIEAHDVTLIASLGSIGTANNDLEIDSSNPSAGVVNATANQGVYL